MPPNYAGQNLRGRSFKGEDLTGANFSKADIRGTDFTNATLKDADFTGAKAGLQRHWAIGLLIVSWLMSAVSGFFSIFLGLLVVLIFIPDNTENFIMGIVSLIILLLFCITTIYKGLTAGLGASAELFAGAGAVAGVVTIAGAIAGAGSIAIAGVAAGVVAGAVPIAGAGSIAIAIAGAAAVALTLFSAYIGWRSLTGNEKDAGLHSFVIAFAATGGTSFRDADLTDADFTGAILRNTDFRKANLTRTRFYEAKKLDLARVGDSILAKRDVLNLLVSCNGRNKSYLGANLKGANLLGADLKEANLKDANITETTFQGACLDGVNLTLAQAIGTNFTSAQMTGACVEAWNIESSTQLDNVDCRFVYLLEHPKLGTDDRERRPSSGEFQPGEFTKLFEEVLNTVDLIFRDGIDWKAFVNAFQNVQNQNQDTELGLQSIENKGDGVVVVKVGVPDGADKEKIHSDFTHYYQLGLQAGEEKYKAQLQAKDNEIVIYRQQSADMKEIVSLLANKPINVQVDNKLENKNMTNSNDYSRKFENSGTLNNSGQINLGEISGTVTNTINELPSSPEPDKPGVKELLAQLQAAIEAEKDLPQEDKAEALEQVKTLAEAGKSPQEGAMQKAAKTAVKILKGTVASLPSATKLVEECSKLLPLISQLLGLG
ncbi:pentapeptide repeat-containing protein [Nodularia sphaerocarpa]|uniref:pentapeptide repeat-containing protein n=1 Tax=Nodularia sphaerocarpa TaxID=137816 RepID=UPI00233054F3|nr:pentapeptide repeat-containing protein [Nodularia sphaerocarpa]MDB9375490.1 pentapeptide repeat-containing protein [Nodularia sphaerocarpa CS-585]